MKTFLPACLRACFFTLLFPAALSAQYQTDFGLFDSYETTWDAVPLRDGQATSISNTNHNVYSSMLLSGHNAADGRTTWTTNLYHPSKRLYGRSLALLESGKLPGYLLAGFERPISTFVSRAFMLRTDHMGVPMKYWRKANGNRSEVGVATEVIDYQTLVAGNSAPAFWVLPAPAPPARPAYAFFWAARFDSKTNPVWSFHYPAVDTFGFNYTIHESCTGFYKNAAGEQHLGLAVVGFYSKPQTNIRHTFVSMIDFDSGAEIWRTPCPSGMETDEGLDIVYDPKMASYMAVGYALDENKQRRVYTAVVNAGGAFLGGSVHDAAVGGDLRVRSMEARDVCLSLKDNRVVITGYLTLDIPGGYPAKTFVAQLTHEPKAQTDWCWYYDESFPDLRGGSESIQQMGLNTQNPNGYLVGTGGQLYHEQTGHPDGQLIRILTDGTLGGLEKDCKIRPVQLKPFMRDASRPVFRFRRISFKWVPDRLLHERVDLRSSMCNE